MDTDTQEGATDGHLPPYPSGGTQLVVRRWRDSMEAYALKKKCGPALGSAARMPMRMLND